jgi:hypothetical protein
VYLRDTQKKTKQPQKFQNQLLITQQQIKLARILLSNRKNQKYRVEIELQHKQSESNTTLPRCLRQIEKLHVHNLIQDQQIPNDKQLQQQSMLESIFFRTMKSI